MIRVLTQADATWAAQQHAALMPNSVFAAFGVGFLRCFYRVFAQSKHAVAYVWEDASKPAAVITATSNRSAFLRGLILRHGPMLAAYAVLGLMHKPCRRLVAQLRHYPRHGGDTPIQAEMIFITVDPCCRGKKVAHRLIEAVLSDYAARRVNRVHVTIERANAGVRRILDGFGFKVVSSFLLADKQNDLLQLNMAERGTTP